MEGCVLKSALVTGGSRGIGAAAARALARDGWRLTVSGSRDSQAGRETAAAVERWLDSLPPEDRWLFLRRYWYGERVDALARQLSATPNGTAQRLRRLRASLRRALEQEGVRL